MEIIVWLALIIFFVVLEIATVGLTSIWLAGGSLAGLICAQYDVLQHAFKNARSA